MGDPIRDIMLIAVSAARNGDPPDPSIVAAIASGDHTLKIDQLKFDSLAWMEFCISVELQSGRELTPVDIEAMSHVFEIEDWLRTRAS